MWFKHDYISSTQGLVTQGTTRSNFDSLSYVCFFIALSESWTETIKNIQIKTTAVAPHRPDSGQEHVARNAELIKLLK